MYVFWPILSIFSSKNSTFCDFKVWPRSGFAWTRIGLEPWIWIRKEIKSWISAFGSLSARRVRNYFWYRCRSTIWTYINLFSQTKSTVGNLNGFIFVRVAASWQTVLRILIREPVPFWPRDPGWVKKSRTVLRIRDVYPGSWFLPIPDPGSRIPDPKTATKGRGEKKFVVKPIFVATNFTKL